MIDPHDPQDPQDCIDKFELSQKPTFYSWYATTKKDQKLDREKFQSYKYSNDECTEFIFSACFKIMATKWIIFEKANATSVEN